MRAEIIVAIGAALFMAGVILYVGSCLFFAVMWLLRCRFDPSPLALPVVLMVVAAVVVFAGMWLDAARNKVRRRG
jgi:hypothetical protein